jgi:hypothetical protein
LVVWKVRNIEISGGNWHCIQCNKVGKQGCREKISFVAVEILQETPQFLEFLILFLLLWVVEA